MSKSELVADAVAVAGITNPWWMPNLHDTLSIVLQVISIAFIALQIFTHLRNNYWRK